MTQFVQQYFELVKLQVRMGRQYILMIGVINVAFAVGLVVGIGYLIPDVSETTALYIVTGAATQMIVTVSTVGLPQTLSEAKAQGRLEYFFTLPISREAYLLSLVTYALMTALPALGFALALGAWHYDLSLELSPWLIAVVPLSVLAMAGIGAAIAIVVPYAQLTNAITQLVIFYVLFFAPVLLPKEQLPTVLRHAADFLPPTYVADGYRATLTDLPGTNLGRSLLVLAAFGVGSLGLSSAAVRRRG